MYIRPGLREGSREGIPSTGLSHGSHPTPSIPSQVSCPSCPPWALRISFSSFFFLFLRPSLSPHCLKCSSCLPSPLSQLSSSPFPSWPHFPLEYIMQRFHWQLVARRKKGVNPETVPPNSCHPTAAVWAISPMQSPLPST